MRALILAGTAAIVSTMSASAQSPFDGFYTAVGIGYGVGASDYAGVSAWLSSNTHYDQPKGFDGVAASGYNIINGNILYGIEVDGRFGKEKWGFSETVIAPYYYSAIGSSSFKYDYSSDYSAHIAARIGATFQNTLIFVKFGLGLTEIKESVSIDETQLRILNYPSYRFGGTAAASREQWLPSATVGIGAEYNMGRWFGRIAGEIEGTQIGSRSFAGTTSAGDRFYTSSGASAASDAFWTARAMGMIGVRF